MNLIIFPLHINTIVKYLPNIFKYNSIYASKSYNIPFNFIDSITINHFYLHRV